MYGRKRPGGNPDRHPGSPRETDVGREGMGEGSRGNGGAPSPKGTKKGEPPSYGQLPSF